MAREQIEDSVKGGVNVEIRIGGRWARDSEARCLLELHATRIKQVTEGLAKEFKFSPPQNLILRPLYFKGTKPDIYGRITWYPAKHPLARWQILMTIPLCLTMPDKGLWVIDHECSHLASAIKWNDWTHGDNFFRAYMKCKEVVL